MTTPSRALLSDKLSQAGFRHAFFTRNGGVSPAPFDTLNFSVSVGDDPRHVHQNLGLAAGDLGVTPEHIFYLDQIHSAIVMTARSDDDADAFRRGKGDGVVSHDPRVACAIRTADCAPVLIGDRTSGAVVAVHSGWKSTVQDIVSAGIRALRDLTPAQVDLVAAVGPHIEVCCFEVGPDVAETLRQASPDPDVVRPGRQDRPHVDLRRVLHAQLVRAGVAPENIDHVRGCTVCGGGQFFSFRRDGQRSGRMMAAIVAK